MSYKHLRMQIEKIIVESNLFGDQAEKIIEIMVDATKPLELVDVTTSILEKNGWLIPQDTERANALSKELGFPQDLKILKKIERLLFRIVDTKKQIEDSRGVAFEIDRHGCPSVWSRSAPVRVCWVGGMTVRASFGNYSFFKEEVEYIVAA